MRHSNTRLEHGPGEARGVQAFAPGRVNLIGEHTDYNDGLCLPFAVKSGITVTAEPAEGDAIEAVAADLGEREGFEVGALGGSPFERSRPATAGGAGSGRAAGQRASREQASDGERFEGWRAFVAGAIGELGAAGYRLPPARLTIAGDLPQGAGLSSSAALGVALTLALCELAGARPPERVELARLCSRIENDWAGAETGLLDPLASLFGEAGHAVRIDMRGPDLRPVPLDLRGHTLALLDSGAAHDLSADSGYNERRAECRAACEALGVDSLRDATTGHGLPDPLDRRVRHVIAENERVDAAVAALGAGDMTELGALLDASHASLRDDYEVSVPEVERAVEICKRAGALGARIMGGGFGGAVVALFPPGAERPADAVSVAPGPAARIL
jgi:galactokinase